MTFNILKCEFLEQKTNRILSCAHIILKVPCSIISAKSSLAKQCLHLQKSIPLSNYKSMFRPILEYVSPVWDPHASNNINKVNTVVEQPATDLCFNDFSTLSTCYAEHTQPTFFTAKPNLLWYIQNYKLPFQHP